MKVYLKVKPRASKNLVKKINKDLYHVWVTAPATKGHANKAVIYLLAKYLKLKPNQIFIKKGLT
ncbi:MAG: DUF167 domain-containing protein, partial [Candidatus Beckwithbacteria bacterium]